MRAVVSSSRSPRSRASLRSRGTRIISSLTEPENQCDHSEKMCAFDTSQATPLRFSLSSTAAGSSSSIARSQSPMRYVETPRHRRRNGLACGEGERSAASAASRSIFATRARAGGPAIDEGHSSLASARATRNDSPACSANDRWRVCISRARTLSTTPKPVISDQQMSTRLRSCGGI